MKNVILCLITLALANYIVEAWHDVPDYMEAVKITWSQMWALIIYHVLWENQ